MAPENRVEHVEILRPEICTLDLNTMNSGGQVVINTPSNVSKMAARIRAARVMPELELFDTGDSSGARPDRRGRAGGTAAVLARARRQIRF